MTCSATRLVQELDTLLFNVNGAIVRYSYCVLRVESGLEYFDGYMPKRVLIV